MKYYAACFHEHLGEYEFESTILVKAHSDDKAKEKLKKILKTWYSDDDPTDCSDGHGDHYVFNGEIEVFLEDFKEIPRRTFEYMKDLSWIFCLEPQTP